MFAVITICVEDKYATISATDTAFIAHIEGYKACCPDEVEIIVKGTDYLQAKIPSRRVKVMLPMKLTEEERKRRGVQGAKNLHSKREKAEDVPPSPIKPIYPPESKGDTPQ